MAKWVPGMVDGFEVLEYGFFAEPLLPCGYIPPRDDSLPLEGVQNVAMCQTEGVDGFYLLFCTPDWRYVTYSFHDTIESAKRNPSVSSGSGWSAGTGGANNAIQRICTSAGRLSLASGVYAHENSNRICPDHSAVRWLLETHDFD